MEISNEWKQELSVEDFKPFSQKVSLFDLMFYTDDNGEVRTRINFTPTEYSVKGFYLPHNIIVFDKSIFTSDGGIIYSQNTEADNYARSSFNIAHVGFDIRSRPLFLTSTNFNDILNGDKINVNDTSDKEFSNLCKKYLPKKLERSDYYYSIQDKSGLTYAPGFKIFEKDAIQNLSDTDSFNQQFGYSPFEKGPSIVVEDDLVSYDGEINAQSFDMVICENDVMFERTYLNQYSELKAFRSIAVNPCSAAVWTLFKKYYGLQIARSSFADFISNLDGSSVTISPIVQYLLKNCYVLFKCAYYADVVDYRDFGQKLSKSAKVIHDNLILSANGDFNKYDDIYDDYADAAKKTRPYIPTITPSIDRLANEILSSLDENYEGLSVEEKMKLLIEDSVNPSSIVGSLPTESFEELVDSQDPSFTSSSNDPSAAPLWFDSNSRNLAKDYKAVPTVMSKHGNIITDGRVISRTIDELWEAIKRIEAGRKPDSEINSTSEIAYPFGNDSKLKTTSDTRPIVKSTKFYNDGSEKIGDPLYITYEESSKLKFEVTEWVNNPDKIKYSVLSELKDLFAYDLNIDERLTAINNVFAMIGNPTEYAPSEVPYSLRELESILRGIQYNLALLVAYAKVNFTRVGKLGKTLNTGKWNSSAGSLYQLHKDFENKSDVDTLYKGTSSLGKIDETTFDKNQDNISSQSVYLSAAGTWQSVNQFIRLRVKDEEF